MLRTLYRSDLPSALRIESSVQVAPWTEETFKACFESGYEGWVIEKDKQVLGFIIASLTADECHILNLSVARLHQHQGYGRQLLEHALIIARRRGAGVAYLEVRASNTRAITLYKKMHFLPIAERKNYYPTVVGKEDALVFAKRLDSC